MGIREPSYLYWRSFTMWYSIIYTQSCNLYILGFKIWTLEKSNAFTFITNGSFVIETHETFLSFFPELMRKYGRQWIIASVELVPGQKSCLRQARAEVSLKYFSNCINFRISELSGLISWRVHVLIKILVLIWCLPTFSRNFIRISR